MTKKACKSCKFLTDHNKCPNCGSDQFVESWKGRLTILDPEKSEVAKKVGIKKKGDYAIKV